LGKLDGWITDVTQSGFLLDLAVTRKRARAREQAGVARKKAARRRRRCTATETADPRKSAYEFDLRDGTTLSCFVIDVSPSGVAVSADVEPEIGTRLAVGQAVGHVVRRFNEGFAVQFDRLYEMVISRT